MRQFCHKTLKYGTFYRENVVYALGAEKMKKKLCGQPTKHDQKSCFSHNENGSIEVGTDMACNYYIFTSSRQYVLVHRTVQNSQLRLGGRGWIECCCTSTQNGTNMCSVAMPLSSSRLMTLKPKYGRPRLPPPMHPLPPCHRGKGNVECALSNNASRHSRHFSQLTCSLIHWTLPTADGSKMDGWWVGQSALETSFVHSIFPLSSKQNYPVTTPYPSCLKFATIFPSPNDFPLIPSVFSVHHLPL